MNRRRLLILGGILLGVVLLALLLRGVVRQAVLMPLLYTWWVGRLLYRSVPQLVFWVLFMVGALLILWRSLFRRAGDPPKTTGVVLEERMGPVQTWARWLRRARSSYYSRWRLARLLAELTQEILIYQNQMTPTDARQSLEMGSLEAPPEVRAYLQAGQGRRYFTRFSELAYRLSGRGRHSPLELDPERAVQFLEERLEVHRDD